MIAAIMGVIDKNERSHCESGSQFTRSEIGRSHPLGEGSTGIRMV